MLHLLQIMNYMLTNLEYTPSEIRHHFSALQSGKKDRDTWREINHEKDNVTILQNAINYINKYKQET